MKIRLLETIADMFPYLVLLTYIAGVTFCYIFNMTGFLINGSIMAAPAIIASIAFVYIKEQDIDLSEKVTLFSYSPSIPTILFSITYVLALLTFFITPAESKIGLLVVIILYVIILFQALSRRILPAVVLFEIMLVLAVTIYSYTLRSALYFGATDTMPHIYMSTATLLSGHIIPENLGNYAYFPLYHVFVALSSQVLGLDVQTTLFITTCLIYVTTVLFLYLLVNGIFRNEQISLMIALVYAMSADVIFYGTYMVTRTLAYVGFLILLYLLYSQTKTEGPMHAVTRPMARRFCIVTIFVFILLVHQISTPMIIVLLGLLFGLELFIRDRKRVNPVLLMVPITLFACYWTFIAYSFFEQLFPHTDPSLYQNIVFSRVVNQGMSFLAGNIDRLFVVLLGVIGMLYLIWKQQPRHSIIFGILGMIAILLSVPNILTVVFQLVEVLRIDRFIILFLPFLAIVMGTGMYVIAKYLSAVKIPLKQVGVVLIALVVLYGISSLGLVDYEPPSKRYSFDQDEIAGYNHVLNTVPSNSSLFSDYYTKRFFTRPGSSYQLERLGIPYYNVTCMQASLNVSEARGYVIIPYKQFQRGGLLFGMGNKFDPDSPQPYLPTEENAQYISVKFASADEIYSNDGISLYYFTH
ncbi:MAG: hypothetical protein GX932_02805 [Methanomicrobiales archaeon]|nr:hypothetical protein [Methanomicrobiales archaeon]